MPSKSKTKGSSWERDVAKFLGETLGGEWMRVQNSGAFLGGMNFNRRQTLGKHHIAASKGDISAPENMPKFNCECKNYANIAWAGILRGSCKQIDTWWAQTESTANAGDVSFLIFKITRNGSFIVFESKYLDKFIIKNYTVYQDKIIVDFETFITKNVDAIKTVCA